MATPRVSSLLSKFRGCLMGSHVGDCLGGPYEGDYPVSISVLSAYMKAVLGEVPEKSTVQILPYTDDTAMTLSLGRSLVEKNAFDPMDMGKRFVTEYFNQPRRGYGDHVVHVFQALAESDFKDVFEPATRQFGGTGSYGNGAAMRISPAALYCYNKADEMLDVVKGSSLITHTNKLGYNGAILQCFAIDQALRSNPGQPIDPVQFVSNLIDKMDPIEETPVGSVDNRKPFCNSLKEMKNVFKSESPHLNVEAVVKLLGNGVAARRSVPTAIYSFLRGLQPLDNFESENPFVRTMFFSISLGGDTDTISAMAGSIAGAYHGAEMIPEKIHAKCESLNESINLADDLYALCCGS